MPMLTNQIFAFSKYWLIFRLLESV